MLSSNKKRKCVVKSSPVKSKCPHCLNSFLYINQHWAQNVDCYQKQQALYIPSEIDHALTAAFLPDGDNSNYALPDDNDLVADPYQQESCNALGRRGSYLNSDSEHDDVCVLNIVPPLVQLPGMNTVPFVQLQNGNEWIQGFGSIAIDDFGVFNDFGHDNVVLLEDSLIVTLSNNNAGWQNKVQGVGTVVIEIASAKTLEMQLTRQFLGK